MIVGSIDNIGAEIVKYSTTVQKALTFLQNHDFTKMDVGKYPIDGDRVFALVQSYNTRVLADCKPETHKNFLDIQYVVKGNEYMGWCALGPAIEVAEAYDADKDVAFYKELIPESNILLSAGVFAILYPNDVHRPGGAAEGKSSSVIKVVVKIALDTL
ncbi:MAG: YhcH/YjgK/YiaL family protein [Selenomonadaceae bacterium]